MIGAANPSRFSARASGSDADVTHCAEAQRRDVDLEGERDRDRNGVGDVHAVTTPCAGCSPFCGTGDAAGPGRRRGSRVVFLPLLRQQRAVTGALVTRAWGEARAHFGETMALNAPGCLCWLPGPPRAINGPHTCTACGQPPKEHALASAWSESRRGRRVALHSAAAICTWSLPFS